MGETMDAAFESVADSVNDAILAADANGRIVFANRAASALLGRSVDALLGAPLASLMPERFRAAHEQGFARVLAGGESHLIGRASVELWALRGDGSEVPIELSLGSWSQGGEQRFTGVLRDITARRAERRRERAEHTIADVIARSRTLDEALRRSLAALGEAMGWPVGGAWRVDGDRIRCIATWAAAGSGGESFAAANKDRTFARGVGLPGRTWSTAAPIAIEDVASDPVFRRAADAQRSGLRTAISAPVVVSDEVVAVVEFLRPERRERADEVVSDLRAATDRLSLFARQRQADRALAAAVAELERSNADLERFAYVASHDLSEPLRTIAGFAQLIGQRYTGRLDEDADVFIGHMLSGVKRMQALIDGLLVFARLGSADPVHRPVALGAVAQAVVDALGAQITASGGQVRVGELPTLDGDEGQLGQLLQNLVGNALKFSGDAAPEVDVSARRDDDAWVVAVADRGIGIDPAQAEHVFEMFSRLESRERYEGTGIGLAICRRIAQAHGGEIRVLARAGGGTVFEVRLRA